MRIVRKQNQMPVQKCGCIMSNGEALFLCLIGTGAVVNGALGIKNRRMRAPKRERRRDGTVYYEGRHAVEMGCISVVAGVAFLIWAWSLFIETASPW